MCETSSLSLSRSGLLLVFCFFETESPEPYFYVAKGNLEHLTFLPPPSKSWDYKCAPSEPAFLVFPSNVPKRSRNVI